MVKYMYYNDETVELNVDLWLERNAGILSTSQLGSMLEERFSCIPVSIVSEAKLKKLNRDPRLENRIKGKNVYHKRFDIAERLDKIHDKARGQGRVKKYSNGRYNFEYAIINSSEVPEELHLQSGGYLGEAFSGYKRQGWSKPISEAIANNEYYIFVVGDKIPKEFQEFPAVHEYTELMTKSHGEATRYEFVKALEKGDDFLDKYTRWWASHCKDMLEGLNIENKDALRNLLPTKSIRILEQEKFF